MLELRVYSDAQGTVNLLMPTEKAEEIKFLRMIHFDNPSEGPVTAGFVKAPCHIDQDKTFGGSGHNGHSKTQRKFQFYSRSRGGQRAVNSGKTEYSFKEDDVLRVVLTPSPKERSLKEILG